MKQKVILLAEYERSARVFERDLQHLFGEYIDLKTFSMEKDDPETIPFGDGLIVTSAYYDVGSQELRNRFFAGRRAVILSLALQKRNLMILNAYPAGSRALVVNITLRNAEETIAQLYQAGYDALEYIPWTSGEKVPENIDLVISPGEPQLVPEGIGEAVEIGHRLIDASTIIELCWRLDLRHLLTEDRFREYFSRQKSTSAGLNLLLRENQVEADQIGKLLQVAREAFLIVNEDGQIVNANFAAADLLGTSRGDLLGRPASAFLPAQVLDHVRATQLEAGKTILTGGGRTLRARMFPVVRGKEFDGILVELADADEKDGTKPGRSLPKGGNTAKYHFSDICSASPEIRRTIAVAKQIAHSDSSVLIVGESGTGKELFANAIHNESRRAAAPFVAINCAAMPESLMDSELFGYEEGAFTGARRGGRVGLFETADTGTIFLDEVEAMPTTMQLKLLRVIQEQEIMRVGGTRPVSIDVRIICATNCELQPLIDNGTFRHDLFYRISALPLRIPPLRERPGDIRCLLEDFKDELHYTFLLTDEARDALLSYDWPGNIRELRNCVEYLGCQNLPVIGVGDFPFSIRERRRGQTDPAKKAAPVFGSAAAEVPLRRAVLGVLAEHHAGRGQIQSRLAAQGIDASLSEVRSALEELKRDGLVRSGTGRGGSELTDEGRRALERETGSA